MVCPLRFVLAGVSAAIVLFLAIDLLWGSSKDDLLLTPEVRALMAQKCEITLYRLVASVCVGL